MAKVAAANKAETNEFRSPTKLFPEAPAVVHELYAELEQAEQAQDELWKVAEVARTRFHDSQSTVGSCVGNRREGGSPALRREWETANNKSRNHYDVVVYARKLELHDTIVGSSMSDLASAAAIQGIFQSGREARHDYTSRFLAGLERLDAELQPGSTICVHRREELSGVFHVLEPGVRLQIVDVAKNKQYGRVPRVMVSTGSVEGTFVTEKDGHRRLEMAQKPDGIVAYGIEANTSVGADGLGVLERDFHSLQLITSANALALGDDVAELVSRLTRLESLLYLIAARSIGELSSMDARVETANAKELRSTLLSVFAGRIMCTTIPDTQKPPYWYQDTRRIDYVGVGNLESEHPRILGAFADVLGVSEGTIRSHTWRIIRQLEHDILVAGTIHASQWPAAEIGRKRLNPFLQETGVSK